MVLTLESERTYAINWIQEKAESATITSSLNPDATSTELAYFEIIISIGEHQALDYFVQYTNI